MEVALDQFFEIAARLERPRWRQKLDDFILWAGSKSNYAAKKVIEELFGGVAYVSASNVYLALLTVTPDDTSTGSTITETDYASYARTQIGTGNNQTDAWNAATGTTTAVVTNKNAITCPSATGASTNPLIAVALVDAASAGNVLIWATITSTPIANGDTPKVNAGGISLTED
jgi:hypothetical protein